MAVKMIDMIGQQGLPPDIATEQARLQQLQQIAQMMIEQGMDKSSPIVRTGGGNPFAVDLPNFADPVASLVNSQQGRQQLESAMQQQGVLSGKVNERTQRELAAVLNARFGGQKRAEGPPTGQGELPLQNVPGSYVEALRLAQQGTMPGTRAVGAKMAEGLTTPKDTLKEAQHFDPAGMARYEVSQDPQDLIGRAKSTNVEGMNVRTQDGKVVGSEAAVEYEPPTIDPATGLPGQFVKGTGEFKSKTGGNVTLANQKDLKGYDTELKILEEGRKDYLKTHDGIQRLVQAKADLLRLPADRLGSFADIRTAINKFFELVSDKRDPTNAEMQVLEATLGGRVLEQIRLLAPVANYDVKMMKSVVGSTTNTKDALDKILEIALVTSQKQIQTHREQVRSFASEHKLGEGFVERFSPAYEKPFVARDSVGVEAGNPESDVNSIRKQYGLPPRQPK